MFLFSYFLAYRVEIPPAIVHVFLNTIHFPRFMQFYSMLNIFHPFKSYLTASFHINFFLSLKQRDNAQRGHLKFSWEIEKFYFISLQNVWIFKVGDAILFFCCF
ncbi:hypothetical protein ACJX0J_012077 [Zea mays]